MSAAFWLSVALWLGGAACVVIQGIDGLSDDAKEARMRERMVYGALACHGIGFFLMLINAF